MKQWGMLLLASVLLTTAAFAAPQTPTVNVAMPLQVQDEGRIARTPAQPNTRLYNALDQEKAKLSVEMDQTNEKLEQRMYDLKTKQLNTHGFVAKFKLNQQIDKLKDQKASVQKLQNKINSKKQSPSVSSTKKSWEKLKLNIDKHLESASN